MLLCRTTLNFSYYQLIVTVLMHDFQFKPFCEMTEEDYAKVGFKSGLEIHQQLLTDKKLFCRCPAGKYSDKYNAEILRHMRPTLSELGEYDGTALMEFKTKKEIVYRIHRDTICTYEMDDTPPFQINEDALDIALSIGMLYNCKIVDEIHIARKQYLDGSIPTGFQRTSIFALDGKIPYKNREINIVQLSIEEDACREVSDIGHQRVYLTDRLGMPLIETVTAPEMRTPNEVAEVAQICRRLVRSTGKVRTGIGAARQDVNVSVEGGTRVEIKGVPKITNIPLLTYNEAMRQWNLLRLRDELHRRGITPSSFEAKVENVTKLLKKTYYLPIQNAVHQGMEVNCVVLRGFKDLLQWRTQTDTYFSREISDRIRVIACLTTIPNMINSDGRGETLGSAEWQKLKKASGAGDNDTMVIVWGNQKDVETASKEIIIRAREAAVGIPSETRQALRDGTNGFERILPGPDRMYPDTDLPPKRITEERLAGLKKNLPEQIWLRESYYTQLNVPKDLIQPLSVSPFAPLFKKAVTGWNLDPVLTSVVLIQFPKRIKRKGLDTSVFCPDVMEKILMLYKDGRLVKDGILPLMLDIAAAGTFDESMVRSVSSLYDMERNFYASLDRISKTKLRSKKNFRTVLMSALMQSLRGRANGSDLLKMIDLKLQENANAF